MSGSMFNMFRQTAKNPSLQQSILSQLFPTFFPPKFCEVILQRAPRIALILSDNESGSDEWETQETVCVLLHLSRLGAECTCFVPKPPASSDLGSPPEVYVVEKISSVANSVILPSDLASQQRKVRKVLPLSVMDVTLFDAVIIPGGLRGLHGINSISELSGDVEIEPNIEKVIKEFHFQQKPIGVSCMAPILAAKALPGVSVTTGIAAPTKELARKWPYAQKMAETIVTVGGIHVSRHVSDVHVDDVYRVVSTPGFLCNTTSMHEVHDGLGRLVEHVLDLVDV